MKLLMFVVGIVVTTVALGGLIGLAISRFKTKRPTDMPQLKDYPDTIVDLDDADIEEFIENLRKRNH